MNQIYADSNNMFPLEDIISGTVFVYDNDYYMRTQESDEDGNILCVRLRNGYLVPLDFNKKCEIFTGTLRMECD